MHQVKKGNQRYFGAKARIGVDSKQAVAHSAATSAAGVADKPRAQGRTCRRVKYKNHADEKAKRKNTAKARVRAKAEHPFRILKRVFGFTKARYRGLWKNHQWICAAFALVNLYQRRKRPAPQGA